jgi:hypothetical protein
MSLERIVLADDGIGAWVTDERGRRPAAPGEVYGFDRLAEALRAQGFPDVTVADRIPYSAGREHDAGTAVVIPAGMLRDVAAHDAAGGRLGPRVLLAAADRTRLLDQLERHELAGAVDQATWSGWEAAPRSSLTGRLDVAEAAGADFTRNPAFASPRYVPLGTPAHPDLPSLLLAYLRAYFDAHISP